MRECKKFVSLSTIFLLKHGAQPQKNAWRYQLEKRRRITFPLMCMHLYSACSLNAENRSPGNGDLAQGLRVIGPLAGEPDTF